MVNVMMSVLAKAMKIIQLIRLNNVKTKALLILVHQVIVWTVLVLIIKIMETVLKKIVRQTPHQPVQAMSLEKRLAAVIVKNAVMILVLPALSLIQAPMLLPQNAATNVIIVIRPVPKEVFLIPVRLSLKTNVGSLVKNVLQPVHLVA